jgi:hypothetical protein
VSRDRWSAAALALLALAYLLAARRYPLDTLATPGPGIVPLVAGVALLGVAISLFVKTGRVGAPAVSFGPPTSRAGLADPATTHETGVAPIRPTDPTPQRVRRSPIVLAVALVLYAALLPRLGFIASSFALVVIASRLMGASGWWRPAALAAGVAAIGYLLFARWLGVPLP